MNKFEIIITKYADEFLSSLSEKARDKIIYNLDKCSNGYADKNLFKKLDGTDIWEFRTLYNGVCYRLLSFWDTEKSALVIAVNGFQKKTQKTPKQEIQKAIEIRKEYFNSKH